MSEVSDSYRFVPLTPQVRRVERLAARHNQRLEDTLSGIISVTLTAEQLVHVGSGFKAVQANGKLVRLGARVGDRAGIPGASLKGVLRSRYEAITKSCAGPAPKGGRVKSRSRPDVERARFDRTVEDMEALHRCDGDPMCAACALFGRMSQRSRVTVTDFMADEGVAFEVASMPAQYAPRAHHLGPAEVIRGRDDKPEFVVSTLYGRKFAVGRRPSADATTDQAVEVFPIGSVLRGQLRVFNLRPEELGGLLTVLGVAPRSFLKVGAGKGLGFGKIAVDGLEFRLRDRERNLALAEEMLGPWRKAFLASADRYGDGEDRLVELHRGTC